MFVSTKAHICPPIWHVLKALNPQNPEVITSELHRLDWKVCYRTEEPVAGVRRADLYIRHKYFYTRIGVKDFVHKLKGAGFDVRP